MKKVAIVVFILGLIILLWSCDNRKRPIKGPTEINWQIEVDYLDNVKDTIYLTTPYSECDCSGDEPEIATYNGISTLRLNYKDIASYVKTFRVLSKNKVK